MAMSNVGKPFRVGLIGTGRISDIYLKTLKKYPQVDVVACGSLNLDESRAKADLMACRLLRPRIRSSPIRISTRS